jgi:glycosyltransferase involved in cell wall biosynthesis
METSDGLVSVIIPTYYRNDWLRSAIESALEQTYRPIEVIVVDDSGERHAEPVAREYDVRYVAHERNQGGNPARNTGIAASKGEYVQLLDDDDRILPTKLEKQLAVLEDNPSVGVVYCGIQQYDGIKVLPKDRNRGDVLRQALRINDLHPCQTTTMLFNGDFLRELHPLTTREAGDDLGLKVRAAARTEFEFVDEVLVVQGDPETHRVEKIEFADEILSIVEEFDHLYDRFDGHVRRDALVIAYRVKGSRLLDRNLWSAEAIACFARALYYSGFSDPVLGVALLASLFGRPVFGLMNRMYSRISGPKSREE